MLDDCVLSRFNLSVSLQFYDDDDIDSFILNRLAYVLFSKCLSLNFRYLACLPFICFRDKGCHTYL